jgi:hypothetical protein
MPRRLAAASAARLAMPDAWLDIVSLNELAKDAAKSEF